MLCYVLLLGSWHMSFPCQWQTMQCQPHIQSPSNERLCRAAVGQKLSWPLIRGQSLKRLTNV